MRTVGIAWNRGIQKLRDVARTKSTFFATGRGQPRVFGGSAGTAQIWCGRSNYAKSSRQIIALAADVVVLAL